MTEHELTIWTFTKGKRQHKITATYPMTEGQARKAALDVKGWDVTGWKATRDGIQVKVSDEGDGNLHEFTVTFERTQTLFVEVSAHDEDEARELATIEAKASGSYEWDAGDGDDEYGTIVDVQKGEPVDDDE